MLWYKKSREKWVKFGNINTKFFHTQYLIRRRRNKVIYLFIDDIWCDDDHVLKREVVLYFKKLFQETSHCNPNCLVLDKEQLDRKSTRLNSSHVVTSRMPSSA